MRFDLENLESISQDCHRRIEGANLEFDDDVYHSFEGYKTPQVVVVVQKPAMNDMCDVYFRTRKARNKEDPIVGLTVAQLYLLK